MQTSIVLGLFCFCFSCFLKMWFWQGPQPNVPSRPKLTPFSTSCAFNTILSHRLVFKLSDLGLSPSIYFWIEDLLSYHSHRVRVGPDMSSALSLSTGSPQSCMLHTPIYTHNCTPAHSSSSIITFADDTTVMGLISWGESPCTRVRCSSYRCGAQKTRLSSLS